MKDKEKQYISMKEMSTKKSFEPITNCNCKVENRIDYAVRKNEDNAGAFANLLNQETNELLNNMEQGMQIRICIACKQYKKCDKELCTMSRLVAEELSRFYQPKIPEDSVVFSKEDKAKLVHIDTLKNIKSISQLKELLSNITAINDLMGYNDRELEIRQEERKETAEKIYSLYAEKVDRIILELKANFNTATFNNDFEKTIKESLTNTQIETLIITKNGVKEFTEQFGAEIKE